MVNIQKKKNEIMRTLVNCPRIIPEGQSSVITEIYHSPERSAASSVSSSSVDNKKEKSS